MPLLQRRKGYSAVVDLFQSGWANGKWNVFAIFLWAFFVGIFLSLMMRRRTVSSLKIDFKRPFFPSELGKLKNGSLFGANNY